VSSYLTISPLPEKSGGIFSVALALGPVFTLTPLGFTQHPALWSPDFPHSQKACATTRLTPVIYYRYLFKNQYIKRSGVTFDVKLSKL